jgi:hypothetical protein
MYNLKQKTLFEICFYRYWLLLMIDILGWTVSSVKEEFFALRCCKCTESESK